MFVKVTLFRSDYRGKCRTVKRLLRGFVGSVSRGLGGGCKEYKGIFGQKNRRPCRGRRAFCFSKTTKFIMLQ